MRIENSVTRVSVRTVIPRDGRGARWLSGSLECRTPEREVRGSRPTAAVLCPWARHFTPRKYWLITQEAMAPSWHDWKIVDWDVKPQHNQPTTWRNFHFAPNNHYRFFSLHTLHLTIAFGLEYVLFYQFQGASWCRTVTVVLEFSISTSQPLKILMVYSRRISLLAWLAHGQYK